MVDAWHTNFHNSASPGQGAPPADGALPHKRGSLQEFVHFECTASDVSHRLFPVHEVHKIALLDMRILNLDRNDANLLVK